MICWLMSPSKLMSRSWASASRASSDPGRKAICKATYSPHRNLENWILVLGGVNQEILETSIWRNAVILKETERIENLQRVDNLAKVRESRIQFAGLCQNFLPQQGCILDYAWFSTETKFLTTVTTLQFC